MMQLVQTHLNPYPTAFMGTVQIAATVSCGCSQIGFLNSAIASSPVVYAVPAYQSTLLLFTLILAGTLLEEFHNMSILHFCVFVGGCGLVVVGIAINAIAIKGMSSV